MSDAQRGFRVVPVSVPDLLELTDTRCSSRRRRCAGRSRTATSNGSLRCSRAARLSRTASLDTFGRVSEAWLAAHSGFHGALLQACPNTRLVHIAESLRDVSEVYRCWSVRSHESAARDVEAEHDRIATAAV